MYHVKIEIIEHKDGSITEEFFVCSSTGSCTPVRSYQDAVREVNERNFQLIVDNLKLGLGLVINQETDPEPAP